MGGRKNVGDWLTPEGEIHFGPAISFGIVNVTADSMYSGARSGSPRQAIKDGERLLKLGFDRLDIGAVAARQGPPVRTEDEIAALLPVVDAFTSRGVQTSADTFSVPVADAAIEAGASIINDISGGSEEMFSLLAGRNVGYVLMHIEGPPRRDREPRRYNDPIDHVKGWFGQQIELAVACGMNETQIVIDPGLEFDIGVYDNLEILGRLQ